jgi:hypothetical protein
MTRKKKKMMLSRNAYPLAAGISIVLFVLLGASAGSASAQVIKYSSNATLTGDIFCTDLAVDRGVTLTTNGFNIYCTGTLTNKGVIHTGYIGNGGIGANESPTGATGGGSFPDSYGASGGGGGGSAAVSLGPAQISGSGGNSSVSGGSGGTPSGGFCGTGGAGDGGSTPSAPSITSTMIQTWYSQGISSFLAGGGGGGGAGSGYLCSDTDGSAGGSGAFGIYIQANRIVAGTIETSGQSGGTGGSAGGGGGGGGTILLAYGRGGYVSGTYYTGGGVGGAPGPNGGAGGNGGSGQVLTFGYGINEPPVTGGGANIEVELPGVSARNYVSGSSMCDPTAHACELPVHLLGCSDAAGSSWFSIQQNFHLATTADRSLPFNWPQNAT